MKQPHSQSFGPTTATSATQPRLFRPRTAQKAPFLDPVRSELTAFLISEAATIGNHGYPRLLFIKLGSWLCRRSALHSNSQARLSADHQAARDYEEQYSYTQTISKFRPAIKWSVIFAITLVGEGYDLALMGNFFSLPQFQNLFGYSPERGAAKEIPALWQSMILTSNQLGHVSAMYFAGLSMDRSTFVSMCWIFGQLLSTAAIRIVTTIKDNGVLAYRMPAAFQCVWPLSILICVFFAPESPWWLMRQSRPDLARSALDRLNPDPAYPLDGQVKVLELTDKQEKCDQKDSEITYMECFRGVNLRRTMIAVTTNITTLRYLGRRTIWLWGLGGAVILMADVGIPSTRQKAKTLVIGRVAYLVAGQSNMWRLPKMLEDAPNGWGLGPRAGMVYSGINAIFLVWAYFCLPEICGRSQVAIDELFKRSISARKATWTEVSSCEGLYNYDLEYAVRS
ncbi:hypothetical protein LY76DRAFT_612333 [Colletotrichum caudatum]|nr:hypothetical protein LY76DRAFT_612333 [Colletotrichum caudatum]